MLRTEKPQLPLQLEETAGIQQVLIKTRDTFGNLQVVCKNSQEGEIRSTHLHLQETCVYCILGHLLLSQKMERRQ